MVISEYPTQAGDTASRLAAAGSSGGELLPTTRWAQPPVGRRPVVLPQRSFVWGQLHSRSTDFRLLAASAFQVPVGMFALFAPLGKLSPLFFFMSIVVGIILGNMAQIDVFADDSGVRQLGFGGWQVPWQAIERAEILPGGRSVLWGVQPPRLILHVHQDVKLDRSTMGVLRRHRGRIGTRLRPSYLDAFMRLAHQKGVSVEVPEALPSAPHIMPSMLPPGASD